MGEKKQREEAAKKIKKVLIVGACVIFVIFMILSGMGSNLITGMAGIKPGDTVVLDFTLYNVDGKAVVTSDQLLYKAEMAKGNTLLPAQHLSITANQSYAKYVYPVPVSTGSDTPEQFALFSPEFTAITQGIVGMKDGDKKTIAMPSMGSTSENYPAESLARQHLNITNFRIGDPLTMGVSSNPSAVDSNSTADTYLRIAEVTNITPQGIGIDFGYPKADVSIVSINGR
jgi:hypothetical protein